MSDKDLFASNVRFKGELIFFKDGRKTDDGRDILELAHFMYVQIGSHLVTVQPLPPDFFFGKNTGAGVDTDIDIVGIHILDKRQPIPFPPGNCTDEFGTQFFGI